MPFGARPHLPHPGTVTTPLRSRCRARCGWARGSLRSVDDIRGGVTLGAITLAVGDYPIAVELTSASGANGAIELTWTPPR